MPEFVKFSPEQIHEKIFFSSDCLRLTGKPVPMESPDFYEFISQQFGYQEFWAFQEIGQDDLSQVVHDSLHTGRGVTWGNWYFWVGTHEVIGDWLIVKDQGDTGASGVDSGQLLVRGYPVQKWTHGGNSVEWEQPTKESTCEGVLGYFRSLFEFSR